MKSGFCTTKEENFDPGQHRS